MVKMQSGRGGRERSRRDYPPRSEERNHHGRSNAPPSRHLWVGNLSHNLSERTLKEHFLRFGELESLAFQPGRSYAFINYKHDEEAFAAIRALQGFFVAGNPLKIEFAKAVSLANLWLLSLQVYLTFCLCILSIFNYNMKLILSCVQYLRHSISKHRTDKNMSPNKLVQLGKKWHGHKN